MTRAQDVEERIRAAFDGDGLPPSPEHRARILARRRAGDRVRLVDRPARSRWAWVVATAAALAALGTSYAMIRHRVPGPERALAESALLPANLLAQGSATPSYPELRPIREIRPGELSYATLRRGQAFGDSIPVHRSRLERSTWHDAPAWLMLSRPSRDNPAVWQDSVWFDTADARQLARSTLVMDGRARQVDEFREHEILRGFMTANGTTWTVISREDPSDPAPNGFILRSDALGLALRRAPLARDWRGSIALVTWPYYSRAPKQWYDLAVVDEEAVTVPAGTFDCWKIRLGPPAPRRNYGIYFWVSKQQQWVVQWGIDGDYDGPWFKSILVRGTEE